MEEIRDMGGAPAKAGTGYVVGFIPVIRDVVAYVPLPIPIA